jgi:hypothetical protein
MLCNCKDPCFMLTQLSQEGKFEIYKCNNIFESKKKKKCDFVKKIFISEIKINSDNKKIPKPNKIKPISVNFIKTLNDYIKLFELSYSKNLPVGNICANINFILKRLNYKLFIMENESIDSLKIRISNPPDNIIIKTKKPKVYHIIDLPDFIQRPRKIKKNRRRKYTSDAIDEYMSEDSDEENEMSDDSSDKNSETNEDGFDIDEIDSDMEDDHEDDGNYSD